MCVKWCIGIVGRGFTLLRCISIGHAEPVETVPKKSKYCKFATSMSYEYELRVSDTVLALIDFCCAPKRRLAMSLSLADSSASFADEKVVGVAWSHVRHKQRVKNTTQAPVDHQPVKFQTRLLGTFSRHVVLYQVRFSRVLMWIVTHPAH